MGRFSVADASLVSFLSVASDFVATYTPILTCRSAIWLRPQLRDPLNLIRLIPAKGTRENTMCLCCRSVLDS
uniref:Uncharacterized protein n=1 Tax=uncultured Vibrionales bacterium HF0010_22E23 TaxID=710999 RepID=E0XRJ6_9GAMM|nr:hypothetical protein [uncultured Vibrionales bacterium HF0010_22E23]